MLYSSPDWNNISVQLCEYSPSADEAKSPALTDHRIILPLNINPAPLIQKRDNCTHESNVRQGDIIFVPAGYESLWRCPDKNLNRPNKQQLHIYFKHEWIKQVAEAHEIDPDRLELINNFGQQDEYLYSIAKKLLEELRSPDILEQSCVQSLRQILAIHLLRNYSTLTQPITSKDSGSNTKFKRITDYIQDNLAEITIEEITQAFHISYGTLNSLCKHRENITLHQYIIRMRVKRAKLLLSKNHWQIADIAKIVGFYDQSHLTREFKKIIGTTPHQYRREKIVRM